MDWYDVLHDVLDVVSKLSIIVAVAVYLLQRRGMRLQERTMHLQHERARLEKAAAAISEFSKSLTPRSAAARKLVRHFNTAQFDHLDAGEEFELDADDGSLLLAALPDHIKADEIDSTGKSIRLTKNQSYHLRWEIVSRLNASEILALYWLKDVADKKMIEEQLVFLLEKEPNVNIMTTCGRLASRDNYPALQALIDELETQRNGKARPKKIDD